MHQTRAGLFFSLSMVVAVPACITPLESDPGAPPTPATLPPPLTSPSEITVHWKAPVGTKFTALAAATAGDEGAVVYAESETMANGSLPEQATFKLQRLDRGGAARGPVIVLGAGAAEYRQGLTVASDGSRYLTCWAGGGQISCTTVPVAEGGASAVQVIAGTAPSLAYNEGTWALAYTLPGKLAVVALTEEGKPALAPTLFAIGEEPYFGELNLLAGTKQGFVLVGGGDVQVHPLDFTLSPRGAPIDLGAHSWGFGAIATSGNRVVINLAKPYGSTTFFFDDATLLDTQEYGGGGKIGLRVALATEGSSFGMLSNGDSGGAEGGLLYRLLTPKNDAVSAKALPEDHRSYDDSPVALLQLGGEPFFAVTQAYSGEEIIVARAPRP